MSAAGERRKRLERLLKNLYRRRLDGKNLRLIVTDSCEGMAVAMTSFSPQAPQQYCWVHKIRNILEQGRRDHEGVKRDSQAIYQAEGARARQAGLASSRIAGRTSIGPCSNDWSATCQSCLDL